MSFKFNTIMVGDCSRRRQKRNRPSVMTAGRQGKGQDFKLQCHALVDVDRGNSDGDVDRQPAPTNAKPQIRPKVKRCFFILFPGSRISSLSFGFRD